MDRGRAGGYVGNNFVQIQLNKKKRQQHLDRIKKIKTRKPGSSATLDNNPPVIIEAMLNDPRKSALRHHFNFVTERENKVLLKRISAILTAPPKITDKQYQEMKKLVVPSTKGFRNVYEQNVTTQKNKEFFDHLKKLQPYYKAEDWEKDYQKQLFNQKFMRQVKYKRPPGFVDPLAPPVSDDASTKKLGSGNSQISEGDKDAGLRSSSSSHVSKIRAVKLVAAANKGSKSVNSLRQGRKVSSSRGPTSGPHSEVAADEEDCYGFDFDTDDDRGNSSSIKVNVYVGREGGDEYEHDSFFRDDEFEFEDGAGGADENRVQLATIHRTIRIAEDNPAPDSLLSVSLNQDQTVGVMFAEADIQCWLVNNEYVVISAVTLDKGRILDAEAEISIADLSIIRGLPPEQSLLGDTASLEFIAREMVENVELKVDCGVGRLVLNLVSEDGDEDYEDGMDPNALLEEDGPLSHTTQSAAQTKGSTSVAGQPISALLHSGSLVSEEEIESMLLGDQSQTVLLKGVRLPVSFNVNANAQSVGSITALIELAKRAKRIEHVYALLKFVSTSDDQMAVTAQFITDTTFMFKRGSRHRPAVQTGSVVRVTTSLPSVIQADPDMLLTFAENLVQSLKVEHDCKTGENELIIIA